MKRNPPLVVFGNPRRPIISKRVYEIAYKHAEDGKAYKHDFASGVCCELLPDGSARLYRMDGKPVWEDI